MWVEISCLDIRSVVLTLIYALDEVGLRGFTPQEAGEEVRGWDDG